LNDQKKELTDLHTQLYNKFEVMANQILDSKSDKFTKMNEEKIKALIEPLGKDIEAFKKSVQDESKERFSLANEVQKLVLKNDEMSEVAINLTKALKGESKTQGNWGEMILESLLEKSGLRKGEQYFMEHQLQDQDGQALRSSSEGKKMRPDAVIRYPDDRTVIVDSKVSLTAFSRSLETENDESYQAAIKQHVSSLKAHIDALSAKGYDDYNTSLDFVLMFLPSEPAYIAAMQADPELWNYAYEKRILLQSPTNLITSLKLIAELWKREAHNQNAQAIADRGAKLYDKFVGFVENLQDMGVHLDKAKEKYDEGFKQLSTGRGNLLNQAGHLKAMVGKTKKELPTALNTEHIEMEDELS
jgi:DNA recombination protein RmuC